MLKQKVTIELINENKKNKKYMNQVIKKALILM